MQAIQYPKAERQRVIGDVSFAEGQVQSLNLPRDTVLKELLIRLTGSVVTTYGSGTPVADAFSTIGNLVSRLDVIVNGNRTVCSVDPKMLRFTQIMTSGVQGERRSSAGASASAFPTVDQGFVYGSTTQITSVNESVILSFAHLWCKEGTGREATWLNLKGAASAELRFSFASFSALLGYGNTAPVVFSSSTLSFRVTSREASEIDPRIVFSDWKRTTKVIPFTAQTTDYAIDINRGNKLSGIMMLARNGASGTASSATGKLASNTLIEDISFVLNGQSIIKKTYYNQLMAENRNDYGIVAPMASNVSALDGVAFMNFLARGDISTALSLEPPAVDNAQLIVSSSSTETYTSTATLLVQTDEVVNPR